MQLFYNIWWLEVVVPMLSRGETRMIPLAMDFLLVMVSFALVTPWQQLFDPKRVNV